MEFLSEYALFFAKTITIIGGLAFLATVVVTAGQRFKRFEKQGHIEVTNLNEKYEDMSDSMRAAILSDVAYETYCKAEKKEKKSKKKKDKKQVSRGIKSEENRPKIFVINFTGDIRASACDCLAEQVSAVLMHATQNDEVLVRLESSGGMVHSYGLAASQLQRIRDKEIPLTVCVDKVAASGGYMMACIANQLLAAPFAIVGSIGVIAQIPNVHRLLKKHDIDFETLTAGEYKRTLTVFGENTEKGRHKFQQEIQETHDLFKDFVLRHRPALVIDSVATGEVWFGQKAIEHGLIDAIRTSDDYLYERHVGADIYKVDWVEKHGLTERLGIAAEVAVERVLFRWLGGLDNPGNFFR